MCEQEGQLFSGGDCFLVGQVEAVRVVFLVEAVTQRGHETNRVLGYVWKNGKGAWGIQYFGWIRMRLELCRLLLCLSHCRNASLDKIPLNYGHYCLFISILNIFQKYFYKKYILSLKVYYFLNFMIKLITLCFIFILRQKPWNH